VLRGLPPIHRLPQADFLRALEERYGIADPVLRDRDMADLLFPWLQADMEMLETWSYVTENRLPVRIVAYGGLEDRTISKDALVAWQEQSSLAFSCQMLRGDHFYLLHDPGPLLTSLGRVLSGTLD
jgi:medium-chain acyl-[acyl-carrier-protein] hydrolase